MLLQLTSLSKRRFCLRDGATVGEDCFLRLRHNPPSQFVLNHDKKFLFSRGNKTFNPKFTIQWLINCLHYLWTL